MERENVLPKTWSVLKILIFPQLCKVYRTSYYKRTTPTQNGWIKTLLGGKVLKK